VKFSLFNTIMSLILAAVLAGCSSQMAERPSGYESLNGSGPDYSNVGSLRASPDTSAYGNLIKPGDQIQLIVWGYPEFNTTTLVKDYGTITVPLIGEVVAAGLTSGQLTEQLKQRLSEYVKGDVRLTVSHVGMDKRVSVVGAVNKQGNYPALTESSLVEVLAEAGGPTATADLEHLKIFRSGSRSDVVDVDLTAYLKGGDTQYIPRVGPGDTIFVPEQQNFVRDFSVYASEVVILFGFFALLR